MVTTAGKSRTSSSQMASGDPNFSSRDTLRTRTTHSASTCGQRLLAHAALANDAAETVIADDVGLIGLLADRGGRAGRGDLPRTVSLLQHHGPAVVDDPVAEVHLSRQLPTFVQVFVDGIAAREEDPGNQDLIPDLEGLDLVGGERRLERDHGTLLAIRRQGLQIGKIGIGSSLDATASRSSRVMTGLRCRLPLCPLRSQTVAR
jgi:hypothetical protein